MRAAKAPESCHRLAAQASQMRNIVKHGLTSPPAIKPPRMSLQGEKGRRRRVYLLNGELGRLLLLEVHKAIALGVAGQVRGDLA